MSNEPDGIEIISRTPTVRDWNWWSDFLQREYYGSPSELDGWQQAATAIARDVDMRPGVRLLDLGSGCGELVLQMAMHGATATGVEQSALLIDYCQRNTVKRGVVANFLQADMFLIDPSDHYDVILSVNTSFGYGTDEQNRALIAKIGRWLAPGGQLYLDVVSADHAEAFGTWSDPLADGRFIVDNAYDPIEQTMTSHPTWVSSSGEIFVANEPEVVRIYTRAQMEQMLLAAGLVPKRLQRGMGRHAVQSEDQMLTTWSAHREH